MMFSLIQAIPVFPNDSLDTKNLSRDYPDTCLTMAKNNNKDLSDGSGESSWAFLNTFNDSQRGRYFQFYYFSYDGYMDFKITAYRKPCFIEPLLL